MDLQELPLILPDLPLDDYKDKFQQITLEINTDLEVQRKKMKVSKKNRKLQKKSAALTFNEIEFKNLTEKLKQESYNEQFFYKEEDNKSHDS